MNGHGRHARQVLAEGPAANSGASGRRWRQRLRIRGGLGQAGEALGGIPGSGEALPPKVDQRSDDLLPWSCADTLGDFFEIQSHRWLNSNQVLLEWQGMWSELYIAIFNIFQHYFLPVLIAVCL